MTQQLYNLLQRYRYYMIDVQTREASLRVVVHKFKLSHGKIVTDILTISNVTGFKVATDEDGWTVITLDYIKIYCW